MQVILEINKENKKSEENGRGRKGKHQLDLRGEKSLLLRLETKQITEQKLQRLMYML